MPDKKPYRDQMKSMAFHFTKTMRERIEKGDKKWGESWLNGGRHHNLFREIEEELADIWNYAYFFRKREQMWREYVIINGLEPPPWASEDDDI